MRLALFIAAGLLISPSGSTLWAAGAKSESATRFSPKLATYISDRIAEFDQILAERKSDLKKIAFYVRGQIKSEQSARLVFICTHNSRRSHLSQIWATDAANYYGVSGVECFSGGTEGTAFNPRAIAALERAGMIIIKANDDKNPMYEVQIADGVQPIVCFSKKYSDAPNPKANFCAVVTCSEADKQCPIIEGAAMRIAIPYEDPKVADGTPQEANKYDERCAQICREMLYLFSQLGT